MQIRSFVIGLCLPVLLSSDIYTAGFSGDVAQASREIVILHTNDLHSRLTGSAPESEYSPLSLYDDQTMGGFARIAGIIEQEKEKDPGLIMLDAGDFLMGTLFHALEERHGLQLPLMKRMGYDAVCLGNHEFDFGTRALSNIIQQSRRSGEIPRLLLANVSFDESHQGDDQLQSMFLDSIIKPYCVIEKKGLRIGIFGIIGEEAAMVAPLINPAEFTNPVRSARKVSRYLKRDEGVDLVICLSHSGITRGENGQWSGEDVRIAEKARHVDVIISGHTHTRLDDPLLVSNTIIVQAGAYGRHVGRIAVQVGQQSVELLDYDLIPVNDSVMGNPQVSASVDGYIRQINHDLFEGTRLSYDQVVVETDNDLVCDEEINVEESTLGPLLADAISYYVNTHSGDSVDMALIAAGVIRDRMAAGKQSLSDLFRIVSLGSGNDSMPGYPLAKVHLTGREIKNTLEVLLAVYPSSPSNYCYYSGLEAVYDPDRGLLRKVRSVTLGNEEAGLRVIGTARRDKELYAVAANAYLLKFIGMIKEKSFGLVKVVPKDASGRPIANYQSCIIDFDTLRPGIQEGKEWMALYRYARSFPDKNQNGIPEVPDRYSQPLVRVIPVE